MALSSASLRPYSRKAMVGVAAAVSLAVVIGVLAYELRSGSDKTSLSSSSVPYARLNSGHRIPLLGLGTSGTTGEECTRAITAALKIGYRHIDTAEMYGNEDAVGIALQQALSSGQVKREELFITTKLNTGDHAKKAVEPALQTSLKRLQLDYVDLFLVHWPVTQNHGPTLQPSMQETWAGMEEVHNKGLAKSIGVSNQSPEKIEEWFKGARVQPAVNQVEMHPNFRNDRVLEYARSKNIIITAYAPLSSPGTMSKSHKEYPNLQKDETILKIAEAGNRTAQQVLLQWGLQHGDTKYVSVIPKSANPDHQQNNFDAVKGKLSDADYSTISNFKYQVRYFEGNGLGITKEGPWHTYQELWNEDPPPDQPKLR